MRAAPDQDVTYPDLAGRVTVITGGAAGLGFGFARALARQGARIALFDLQQPRLDEAAHSLQEAGAEVLTAVCDVRDDAGVEASFRRISAEMGPIDILINNAGLSMNMPTLDLSVENWSLALDVMLTGAYRCTHAVLGSMVERETGSILNISSLYGYRPGANRLAYCVAKAGIKMMTEALAVEFAKDGLRINGIAPGYVRTALVEELVQDGRLDIDAMVARSPDGRLAAVEDIAKLALFLLSDQSAHMNGQVVLCDGGWTLYNGM